MTILLLRILLFIISFVSVFTLANRFRLNREQWTEKTRDYWYAQFMWSVAGISIAIEGIIRHTPFRYSFVFILAAAFVNLIGLRRRGPWGTNNER